MLRKFDTSVTIDDRTSSFYTVQSVGSLAETKTYYDILGRVMRVDQEGFKGCRVYQDSEYDVRGRTKRSSLPYFFEAYDEQNSKCEPVADPEIYWSLNNYDNLDRAISVTAPDGEISKTAYHSLLTIVTDAN